jgi:hypothetical protein
MLSALEEKDISILSGASTCRRRRLALTYQDRFTVLIPAESDYAFKLKYLAYVVGELASNEKGTIDLTHDEAHFLPKSG